MKRSIFLGYDSRDTLSYAITKSAIQRRLRHDIPVHKVALEDVRRWGMYVRPTEVVGDRMYDVISEAPMATEFAISRFLVPHLARWEGWALFSDCDILVTTDLAQVFAEADETKAVMCVKHEHQPTETIKMNGQPQTFYRRKNWSSFMLFNCEHPANRARLTLDIINTWPGRDLHAFSWLEDQDIGELSHDWNFLVGVNEPLAAPAVPRGIHFTQGVPHLKGYELSPYAEHWFSEMEFVDEASYHRA